MATIPCQHCGKDIEVIANLAQCPHCQKDISSDAVVAVDQKEPSPELDDIIASVDTARTAIAGTAQRPMQSIVDRTIDGEGMAPNLPEYSSSLKTTDSAFESVDLSSAIPPRAIAVDNKESPGEAQDYRLGEKIGSGSFGVVYRAEQIPLQRTVALKMLKSRKSAAEEESHDTKARVKSQQIKNRNEFLREAQFTGKLEHPNIVPVHDIGLVKDKHGTGNRPFYVMKEIKGESWQSKMKDNSRDENLEILKRVAEAIDYAHDKNIIHCDLKPENVMLGEFGEVLVVDWGQAVDLTRRETYRPGGSPAYISPEMARYWCDTNLDGKATSTASNDIGKHTDVYLLGAILFEIVTALPPHFGLKGETQIDVMRRAAENQIRKHDEFADDELTQIARRALRLDTSESYDTVEQFQDALRDYESRRISIEMRERANELLLEAKSNNDYDAYGKARFGFEESIENWEGNQQSKAGLLDARLSCADLALKDQNFDLGIGMLEDPDTQEEKVVLKKLVDAKRKRDSRKRLVGLLSIALILGGIGSIGLIAWGYQASADALVAKDEAKEATELAAIETGRAETAGAEAEAAIELKNQAVKEQGKLKGENDLLASNLQTAQEEFKQKTEEFDESIEAQEKEVKKQTDLAMQQTELARTKTEDAERASKLAEEESKRAEAQTRLAEAQAKIAKEAEEQNRLLEIRSSIDKGNFVKAREELAKSDDDLKKTWEWARENMRTQPAAIEFLSEKSEVLNASASQDGKRIAFVKPGGTVSVHQTIDFENDVRTVQANGAAVAALSRDGQILAIGIPGDNGNFGKIVIIENGNKTELNEAPSKRITDLQFSSDGQRLLCVGTPSGTRKSTRIENELMVYQRTNGQWDRQKNIRLAIGSKDIEPANDDLRRGTQPEFTSATFSHDGTRILLTAPQGDAHVYGAQGDDYAWIAGTSSLSIDTAIFADDAGSQVVGCRTESDAGTCELFLWEVPGSGSFAASNQSADNVIPLARMDGRVRSMKRSGSTLLTGTGGNDKRISLWTLTGQKIELIQSSAGHSKEIDFCTFIPGETPDKSTIISIAVGKSPEIMKTDLTKYVDVTQNLTAGDEKNENAPRSIFLTANANRVVLGKDNGHAIVQVDGKNVEWEVSAWRHHVLTREFVFAQSGRDNFLQYDRKTGAITRVLNRLSNIEGDRPTRIIKFQVSDDGKTALVARTLINRKPDEIDAKEFQLWNLENQTLIKRLQFGNLFSASRQKGELPTVALSPNGRYVVAGKVGFVVWSTLPGDDQPILNTIGSGRTAQWPNSPINNIVFFDNGSEFAVSWPEAAAGKDKAKPGVSKRTGRIHLYKHLDRSVQLVGRFRLNIIQGGFDTNRRAFEPNTLGARIINGEHYILVRSADSIDLLQLKPGQADLGLDLGGNRQWDAYETIQQFKGSKFASFSDLGSDILILNKQARDLVQRWSLNTKQFAEMDVTTSLNRNFDQNRFASLDSIYEGADGSITIQALRPNKINLIQRDYNTVTLNADLSVGRLRVLSKPTVEYAAVVGDQAITLESGSIRIWKLDRNQANQGAPWLISPEGLLAGSYDFCELSPDESQLLVKVRGSDQITAVDPLSGKSLFEVDDDVEGKPTTVVWAQDSRRFGVGFDNGSIRVMNVKLDVGQGKPVLSNEPPISGTAAVKSLAFSADNSALLAIFNESQNARIYRRENSGWSSLAIGYSNDNKQIVAGDILKDGNRVVTGSNTGQLTIWNAEQFVNEAGVENQDDAAKPENDLRVEDRELFDLNSGYSSEIRFVRFFKNPGNNDQIDVMAAAQGEPNPRVWKTSPQ